MEPIKNYHGKYRAKLKHNFNPFMRGDLFKPVSSAFCTKINTKVVKAFLADMLMNLLLSQIDLTDKHTV